MPNAPGALRRFVTILCLLTAALAVRVEAQFAAFECEQLSTREGLPQNTVMSIVQTSDGLIWVGTQGGLASYDGTRFQVRTRATDTALPSNRIVALAVAENDDLFIATLDRGLARLRRGRIEPLPDSPATQGEPRALIADATGGVWVVGDTLSCWRADRWQSDFDARLQPEVESEDIYALDSEGRLIVHRDEESWRFEGTAFQSVAAWRGPAAEFIAKARDRGIELRHVSGLVQFESPVAYSIQGRSWVMDRAGRTWCATDEGALIIEGGKATKLSEAVISPVASRGMRCGFEDRDGNVWLGMNRDGLLRLRAQPYAWWPQFSERAVNMRRVAVDGRDRVWVRANHDRLYLMGERGSKRVELPPGRFEFAVGQDGRLLLAHEAGLFRLDDGLRPERLEEAKVGGIRVLPSGEFVTTTPRDFVLWSPAGEVRQRIPWERQLFEDYPHPLGRHEGAWWFYGPTGLASLSREGRWSTLGESDGIPTPVRTAAFDGRGDLWLTSYGLGMVRRCGNGDLRRYDQSCGLPDDALGGLLLDSEGRVWINSNRGVIVADVAAFDDLDAGRERRLRCRRLTTPEGNGRGAFRTPQDQLWFTTIDGPVLVDPFSLRRDAISPAVRIVSVHADGREQPTGKFFELPAAARHVEIEFGAVAHGTSKDLVFRFRELSDGAEWRELGSSRRIFLSDLDPGEHHLEVVAETRDGSRTSDPAALSFAIAPYWYERTSLRLGLVLLAALLGFAVHRWRLRGLEALNARLRDEVAQRVQVEDERASLHDELAEARRLELVGRLAGGVAHDFNNILTSMMGRAELLVQRAETDPAHRVRHRAQGILDAGRKAAGVVSQLLGYAGKQTQSPTVVEVGEIVNSLVPVVEPILSEGVRLVYDPAPRPLYVHADPTQIEQALMNLVLNARDAMPEGGQITVGIHDEEPTPGAGVVVLSVRDQGDGIEPRVLPHIFEPFFTTKDEGRGTGLGLASVRGIVEQSGGRIDVESAVGRGSAFRVTLPRLESTGQAASAEESPLRGRRRAKPVSGPDRPKSLPSLRILLCEDDGIIRDIVSDNLRSQGHVVVEAEGPIEAAAAAREATEIFDVLVADLAVPNGNGRDLARELVRKQPGLKVLFISGDPTKYLGANGDAWSNSVPFLAKPFTPGELIEALRELFELYGTRPSPPVRADESMAAEEE